MKKFILSLILMLTSLASLATSITDLKFGQYQIADSQWNVSACMYTSSCEIYSTNPGTMYTIPWWNGQWNWQSGQYVQFALTNDTNNPYEGKVYNSDGTYAGSIGTGHIINMGVDSSGHALFFFVGNDNNTGQLFSANYGFSGNSGYTWTGTLNPSTAQVDSFSSSYGSTAPLTPGQVYVSGGSSQPSGPTVEGGTITQTNAPSNQVIGSGSSYSASSSASDIQTRINTWINGNQQYNNVLYIDQVGQGNTVDITQSGNKNRIDFTMNGNSNVVENTQSGNNYLKIDVPGWGNYIVTNQSNSSGSNYAETKIQGNGNTVNHTQTGNANQMMSSSITGDINTVTTNQSGSAGHYAESKITGNWNSVSITQSGNTANKATVDVTNNGGAASVDIQQSGGKSISIIQGCTNPAGCGTVIRQ